MSWRGTEGEEEDIRQYAITAGEGDGESEAGRFKERNRLPLLANSPMTLIEGSVVK